MTDVDGGPCAFKAALRVLASTLNAGLERGVDDASGVFWMSGAIRVAALAEH